jgi:MinD-like ATPase involved in chromosome partitioning or flagellar assembly
MKTITFYSYKGGTGRSLALANAARYLARLEFRVVALDFDLEAPGLHYKFSAGMTGVPLKVHAGVVDYLYNFTERRELPASLKDFIVDVGVPGIDKPLIHLMSAGDVPSPSYFSKLARINWHDLFYSQDAKGVQLFLELKTQILDELKPDFLLIDSRTGITEMGGAATTLLADNIICIVVPTLENLEGARAVLRSLKRSRREVGLPELDMTVALGRLPEVEHERDVTDHIKSVLNEEAADPRDTLSVPELFVLHSESALQVQESLRIGSDVSPDDSVLLRDYLRLFANVIPRGLVESKVGKLIEQAKSKIWEDPEAALKEVEELAESFGHPEIYSALLRFYEVRNVRGYSALKRAQRLWELTRDSLDPVIWQVVRKSFDPRERWQASRGKRDWRPNMDFLIAVWRGAGDRDLEFADKLVAALTFDSRESAAADILLELIRTANPPAPFVARCLTLLDASKRTAEADALVEATKYKLAGDPRFLEGWAKHVLRSPRSSVDAELLTPGNIDLLTSISVVTSARLLQKAGMVDQALPLAETVLAGISQNPPQSTQELHELADFFSTIGRWDEFEAVVFPLAGRYYPSSTLDELRDRYGHRRRRRSAN